MNFGRRSGNRLTILAAGAACILVLTPAVCSGTLHVIGWQTFENRIVGNNDAGVVDNSPDTNSTFDATPSGSNNGGLYLTGAIGTDASNSGRVGFGQATNNDFLNGSTFGSDLTITDFTLADGSPGARIGPFDNPPPNGEENGGTSAWKFAEAPFSNTLTGDFSITNESDFSFRLERVHFDARGLGNAATSPDTLELRYLATPGELINVAQGSEVQDQRVFYSNTWTERGTENVSQSIAAVIDSAARLAPGESAAFRFLWSGNAGAGQAQIDNVAFSGTFLDQDNGFAEIDPRTIGSLSGDFDGNGIYDCADIDSLVAEIAGGSNNSSFDLNGDQLVDVADRDVWLAEAGAVNLPSGGAYLPGDANLDGSVDVSDFNIWNSAKFTNVAAWCSADFDANGSVDVSDFNIWNGNKFQSSDLATVPEPEHGIGLLCMLIWGLRRKRLATKRGVH